MASDHWQGSNERKFEAEPVHTALRRKLKSRHVAMISIGGVIGTGLFFGTATTLHDAGPLGILLVYMFIGTICLATMLSLGEMITFLPLPGGFIKLAERFVDPAFAFATGWNYWYQWTITLPTELSAAIGIMSYWDQSAATNTAVWISVGLIIAIGINTLGVGAYGESEFWFSSIKVITITGIIILGIVVDLGGGPNQDRIGFRYWKNPGPFTDYDGIGPKGHFLGTCSVVSRVAFSFIGTEAVAMAAAEARDPRRNIPKAIKRIYFRVLVLYIGSVFIIGLLVPSNDQSLNSTFPWERSVSPFVTAFQEAGMTAAPAIINAAILVSAWSAGSGDLYLASRTLYGLAVSGSAPKIFSRTTRSGLPHVAVGVCSCFAFLAYLTVNNGPTEAFKWLSGFCATAGFITWFSIGVTYLRFYKGMKAQGIDRKAFLPFAPRVQPFAAWWCVCGTTFVLFFSAWNVFLNGNWSANTFVTDYVPIVLFPILYVAAKRIMGAHPVKADKMDFVSNVAEFDAMTYDDAPPRNRLEAFWMWLM